MANSSSEYIQPKSGKVNVKMPIPRGIKVSEYISLYVVHCRQNGVKLRYKVADNTLRVVGNYLVFDVASFSTFAICTEPVEAVLSGITIKAPSSATIGWKFKAQITATSSKTLPDGYHIAWYDGDKLVSNNDTLITDSLTSYHNYTAKIVDANGNVVGSDSQSKSVAISVKTSIFDRIISFFQRLFGKGIVVL